MNNFCKKTLRKIVSIGLITCMFGGTFILNVSAAQKPQLSKNNLLVTTTLPIIENEDIVSSIGYSHNKTVVDKTIENLNGPDLSSDTIMEKIANMAQKYEDFNQYVYALKEKISIYEKDNRNSKVLGTLNKDSYVKAIQRDANNKKGFYRIEYKGSDAFVCMEDFTTNIKFSSCEKEYYVKEDTNIYKDFNTKSKKISDVKKTEVLSIIGTSAEWLKVSLDNDKVGYIQSKSTSKDVVFEKSNKTIYTKSGSSSVYNKPDTKSELYGTAIGICTLKEIETSAKWSKISYNGNTVYIEKKNLSYKNPNTSNTSTKIMADYDPDTYIGNQIIDYAKQFVGVLPYVWGGTSLTYGADCSGFICAIYEQYGYNLWNNRVNLEYEGYEVSLNEALPGDIVCYPGHVALYAGNGMVIHAADYQYGVICTSINWSGNYTNIRRVI